MMKYYLAMVTFLISSCNKGKNNMPHAVIEQICASETSVKLKDIIDTPFDSAYVFYSNKKLSHTMWGNIDGVSDYFDLPFYEEKSYRIGEGVTVIYFFRNSHVSSLVEVEEKFLKFEDPNHDSRIMYLGGYHNQHFHHPNSIIKVNSTEKGCVATILDSSGVSSND